MAILFEFVADGAPVFVLGSGDNKYQFVHADDLADACLRAARRPGAETYNIGCRDFGTMRETLQALVDHANTGSHVVSLPAKPAQVAMQALGQSSLVPFAPYHWLLFGESLWFDVSKAERSFHQLSSVSWKVRSRPRSVIMSLPGMIGVLSTTEKLIFSRSPFSAPIHWKSGWTSTMSHSGRPASTID